MLLLCPPSQVTFIWSQTYAHTFNAETLPYVIYTCSLNIYINCKELWMCKWYCYQANISKHGRESRVRKSAFYWEAVVGLIYHFSTGLQQRLSYRMGRCDRYTLILVSVYQVWVRGMLLTKWRNILLMPLALSTGRPGNSVDSNFVWRCACVRD